MRGIADFHHHVAHPVFPHPDRLFEHAAAFDTGVEMFNTDYPVLIWMFSLRRDLKALIMHFLQ